MTHYPRLITGTGAASRARPFRAAALLALLLATAGAARATVLMDDDFTSTRAGTTNTGARRTLDVPRSAEWYSMSLISSVLTEEHGSLTMATTSAYAPVIAYFANDGAPVKIPETTGDTLTFSLKFSLTDTGTDGHRLADLTNAVLRFGVFNSFGNRTYADNQGPGETGNAGRMDYSNYRGYLSFVAPGPNTNTLNAMQRTLDRPVFVNSGTAYTSPQYWSNNRAPTTAMTADVDYIWWCKITRTDAGNISFEFGVKKADDDGTVLESISYNQKITATSIDFYDACTEFDCFALYKNHADILSVTFKRLLIETSSAAPAIIGAIGDRSVTEGDSVILSVTAASDTQAHYAWKKDGEPIAGAADSSTLRIPSAQTADAGEYTCVVSNEGTALTATTTGALAVAPVPVQTWTSDWAAPDSAGRITYQSDAEGNRIPDFSRAGYLGGAEPLPTIGDGAGEIPIKQTLSPVAGDNLAQIQAAIDAVGALEPDAATSYRGAVLLTKGLYEVSDTILIPHSGVVLAGEGGDSEDAAANTVIRRKSGTGTASVIKIGGQKGIENKGRDEMIAVGTGSLSAAGLFRYYYTDELPGTRSNITSDVVYVGENTFQVADAGAYREGDAIIITHPSTQEWINAVDKGGATDTVSGQPVAGFLDWQKDNFNLRYHRYITNIDEATRTLTVDAPVFNTLKTSLSQSYIFKYDPAGLVTHSAVDNLFVDIETEGPSAETHPGKAVEFIETENCWARDVTARHFVLSGFHAGAETTRATIYRCRAIEPHSSIDGARRYNFNAAGSQLVLFRECYARNGRHAFVTDGAGATNSGIVFLDCVADYSLQTSEGHRHWSQALLYDNVEIRHPSYFERTIGLHNRRTQGSVQSHGWSAAHSVVWRSNSGGAAGAVPAWAIIVEKPPTAQNYAIGNFGNVTNTWNLAGVIEGTNQVGLNPASLYKAQLLERTTPPPTTTTVTGITPGMFLPGESLVIQGRDFPGPDDAATLGTITKVTVGGIEVPAEDWRRDSATQITITKVPSGVPETGKVAITIELTSPAPLTLVMATTKSYVLTPDLAPVAPAAMTGGGEVVFNAALTDSATVSGVVYTWEYFDGAGWHDITALGASRYTLSANGAVLTLRSLTQAMDNYQIRFAAAIGNNPPLYSNATTLSVSPAHSLGAAAVALDRKGVVYIANRVRNTVETIDLDGVQRILAGDSLDAAGHVDATGRAARFNAPRGLALGTGTLYVADTGNNVIRAIDINSAAVKTIAGAPPAVTGTGADAVLFADDAGTAARFKAPAGLALGTGGLLYIADSGNHVVRALDPGTGEVTTLAGEPAAAGATGSHFNAPLSLALSEDETIIYVADSANHAIRAVTPAPAPGGGFVINTLAGAPGSAPGSTDGTGTAARFNKPSGVAVADGALYVADTDNSLVRVILGNTVATLAGAAGAPGFRDGPSADARLNKPEGIAADARRDLVFIADTGNNAVRVLDIETAETSTPVLTRAIESYETPPAVEHGGPGANGGGAPGMIYILLLAGAGALRRLPRRR